MPDYNFTLKYRLADGDADHDAIVERLGEAGCTDALVGLGIAGRLALRFDREADDARNAVRTALEDVKSVLPTATLVEVHPDIVTATEVAELVGKTRQNIRKLMLSHSDFPSPVHDGPSVTLWHLSDVLDWLETRQDYKLDKALRETACVAREVNVASEASRLSLRSIHLETLVA
jgi:predicted DNA-binding transcriptional regulator AlpA